MSLDKSAISELKEILQQHRVIVCVGSGGVGKTTVASTLGLLAISSGKKVLLLTVDPSKRLAQTLGLNTSLFSVQKVKKDDGGGELFAQLLNSKYIFDQFVLTHSENSEKAQKLMNNRLYQQLSTTLSGSQEFTSLELLLQQIESQFYDLIILDTPPTQHALDFLRAPQTIRSLFQDSITKWFLSDGESTTTKWWGKIVNFGTQKVFQSLEMLTGKEFIKTLQDFFDSIRNLQKKLRERIERIDIIMREEKTGFIMMTAFDEAKFSEALYLANELDQQKYNLRAVIVNRAVPASSLSALSQDFESKNLRDLHQSLVKYYGNRIESLEQLKLKFYDVKVMQIPDQNHELSSIPELESLIESVE